MKKILLILLVLVFCGQVTAVCFGGWCFGGWYWTPPEDLGYRFNGIFLEGQDFTLYMEQTYIVYENKQICGGYADSPGFETLPPCDWGPGCDNPPTISTNMFKPPAECTLISYTPTNEFTVELGKRISTHKATIKLNCPVAGDYTIQTLFYRYDFLSGKRVQGDCPYSQNLDFTVLSSTDMPPIFDFNLFWSITDKTQRHYVHAEDIDEHLEGNYYVKKFEVKTSPDCTITGGGAMNLNKTLPVGTWNQRNFNDHYVKFEVPPYTDVFQQQTIAEGGYTDYYGNEDTYISGKLGEQNNKYGNSTELLSGNLTTGDVNILIRFRYLEGAIGIKQDSTVLSAFLDLNAKTIHNKTQIEIFSLWKNLWEENTATNNQWKTGSAWGLPGASNKSDAGPYNTGNGTGFDRKTTLDDWNSTETTGFLSEQGKDLNVTKSLQHQINNLGTNTDLAGWIIKRIGPFSGTSVFHSSEATDISKRPKLTVTWKKNGDLNPDPNVLNNLNLYVDVDCNSWGFKDINFTFFDGDGHSSELNTKILNVDANELISQNPYTSGGAGFPRGPPGVKIGSYEGLDIPWFSENIYMGIDEIGPNGYLIGEAYGLTDYETDTNYFVDLNISGKWSICRPDVFAMGVNWCMLDTRQDPDCYTAETFANIDNTKIFTAEDYNITVGGQYQYYHDENILFCDTPGVRKAVFSVGATDGQDPPNFAGLYYDAVDVYVLDFWAELYGPYFAVKDENFTLIGTAKDNQPNNPEANPASIVWYVYDDDCGAKGARQGQTTFMTENTLDAITLVNNGTPIEDQNLALLPGNSTQDVNAEGIVKCSRTGIKTVNLGIITDTGPIYIRGFGSMYVILSDSIRLDSFEVVPSKVKKNDSVEFIAVVKNKLNDTTGDAFDLPVQVQFDVFNEKGELIKTIISADQVVEQEGQKTFTETFDTSLYVEIEEKSPYRVVATARLAAGLGPQQDIDAVNDVMERTFWVLEAEDKLANLPETNHLGIILILVSVVLILSRKRNEK